MTIYKFAARINSFLREYSSLEKALKAVATIPGVEYVDLNFPTHVTTTNVTDVKRALDDAGLKLNGLALRYYEYPELRLGAFTNASKTMRDKAIDVTKRGIDATAELGGTVLTIWPSQDAFRYPLQADYGQVLEWEVEGFRAAAAHNPAVAVSAEYKPDEPRTYYLMNDIGSTLLVLGEVDHPNTGVTIDFCHSLYARENPAYAMDMAFRYSRVLGAHLNDGYGFRDDGMPVGSVNLQQTLEFLYSAVRGGYDGVYYFDTFPDGEGAVDELRLNVKVTTRLLDMVHDEDFRAGVAQAMEKQDGLAAAECAIDVMFGVASARA
ncbi:MAG: sugar phosphate isomerase/epimerase [Planctomycetaceae bacterium]|nr:sugar phosphate isomerase/epimerase [Planctomycetaceae bacterium]